MPSASRSTTPVGIETFTQDLDVDPYVKGLPGDACTCQHLGYVTGGPYLE